MDAKKISFGFNKVAKKPNLLANNKQAFKEDHKVELIKCLEGQEIKLVEEKKEEAPLVIPLKENQKTSTALASLIKRRAVLLGESDEPPPPVAQEKHPGVENSNGTVVPANESLEQRAARELLAATQPNGEAEQSNIVLPLVKADELPLEGAKEATLNDYEEIPIQQFGLAMLRGMGWVEPPKKQGEPPVDEMLFVRPKGMGLGADKALKPKPLLVQPEANEVLEIKKQAYVRILGGKHKDQYGQIEGFDDHAGRVIVKMAIGGVKEAFNEFLCQPVSKKEYAQYGKCINTAKYEEYKKLENEHGQIILKKEKADENPRIKPECESAQQRRRYDDRESGRKRDDKLKDTDGKSSTRRDEYGPHTSKYRDDQQRRYDQEERKQNKTQRYDKRYDDDEERPRSYNANRYRDVDTNRSNMKSHKSRSHDHSDYREQSNSYKHTDATITPARSKSTDDTSESSDTDSDSDSAYERKHKKSSSKAKSKKKASKKNKRSKSGHRRHKSPSTEPTSESTSSSEDERSRNKHHKKKTKKSKKPRSRTRSNSRTKGRR